MTVSRAGLITDERYIAGFAVFRSVQYRILHSAPYNAVEESLLCDEKLMDSQVNAHAPRNKTADAQRDGHPAEYKWRPLRKLRISIPCTTPQRLAPAHCSSAVR